MSEQITTEARVFSDSSEFGEMVRELNPEGGTLPEQYRPTGFEIRRELGRGGQGVVYEALDKNLGRVVALKMLGTNPESIQPDSRTRFRDEMQLSARLAKFDFVRVHQFDPEAPIPWAALELYPTSLEKAWAGKPQTSTEVATTLRLIAANLAEAHKLGIVHRDLKPANILLNDVEKPFIADLGLAKVLGVDRVGVTMLQQILGTPLYQSPEQTQGTAGLTGATDVWACGVIAYWGLTGKYPFAVSPGQTVEDLRRQIREDDPVSPRTLRPDIHPNLETIIMKCLSKNPNDRYSAEALAEELNNVLNDRSIRGKPESTYTWLKRQAKKHPVSATMLLMMPLVCLLVIASLVLLVQNLSVAKDAAEARAKKLEIEQKAAMENEENRGDLLWRLGAVREARDQYLSVLEKNKDESTRLRLRLKCLRAAAFLGENINAELMSLQKEPLGDLRGMWLLDRSVALLEKSMERTIKGFSFALKRTEEDIEATALLQECVAHPQTTAADRHMALALLAEDARTMMEELDKVLVAEPAHPYAICLAPQIALIRGDFENALQRLAYWRLFSPRDPLPELYRAFSLSTMNRIPEAEEVMRQFDKGGRLDGVLKPKTVAAWRVVLEIGRTINRSLDDSWIGGQQEFAHIMSIFSQASTVDTSLADTFRMPIPAAVRIDSARLSLVIMSAITDLYWQLSFVLPFKVLSLKQATAEYEKIGDFVPRGTKLFIRIMLETPLYLRAKNRKDEQRCLEHKIVIRDLLLQTREAPSWYDIRRVCTVTLGVLELTSYPGENKQANLAKARQYFREALSLGPLSTPGIKRLAEFAKSAEDEKLVADLNKMLEEKTGMKP